MNQPLYKQIASSLQAYKTCIENHNSEWSIKHEERIESLVENYLPSGSGIDSGVQFDLDSSKPDKLVFTFAYHHMSEGYYKKWTEHKLTVTPSLVHDFELKITGENYNDVKEYFYQIFNDAFSTIVE